MTIAAYGPIVLEKVKVSQKRATVSAGFQYLFTDAIIVIEGVFNPALNSTKRMQISGVAPGIAAQIGQGVANQQIAAVARPGGTAGAAAVAAALPGIATGANLAFNSALFTPTENIVGNIAAVTDAQIRHTLMQPRQQLVLQVGGVNTLISPAPGFRVDANNGPTPLDCDVVEVIGEKTFKVRFIIKTSFNEFYGTNRPKPSGGYVPFSVPGFSGGYVRGGLPPRGARPAAPARPDPERSPISPLLAHEWTMKHSIDADFFTTRYVIGRAVFRADVLDRFGVLPDQLRQSLFHPVPDGMRRHQIEVTALPDGNTVQYLIVDRQRTLIYDPNVLTRVEGQITVEDSASNLLSLNGIPSPVSVVGGVLHQMGSGDWQSLLLGPGLVRAIWHGRNPVQALGDTFNGISVMPRRTYSIKINAWGQPKANLHLMQREINSIVDGNFGLFPNVRRLVGGFSRLITQDLSGRFLQYHEAIHSSMANVFLEDIAKLLDDFSDRSAGRVPRQRDNSPTDIKADPARGTYLGACVAQILRDTSTPWSSPGDPPNILPRTTGPGTGQRRELRL